VVKVSFTTFFYQLSNSVALVERPPVGPPRACPSDCSSAGAADPCHVRHLEASECLKRRQLCRTSNMLDTTVPGALDSLRARVTCNLEERLDLTDRQMSTQNLEPQARRRLIILESPAGEIAESSCSVGGSLFFVLPTARYGDGIARYAVICMPCRQRCFSSTTVPSSPAGLTLARH
jgi:hypothetical protein